MPCPEAIDVPRIFELYNDAFMYGDLEAARRIYRIEHHRADLCTECGFCEKNCAKRLSVLEWLTKARRLFHP
jgi:predicted aldo/keto reductase-like oxidoreductase